MGAITFSLDNRLLNYLSSQITFDIFVETGTFQGETIKESGQFFKEIHTIEFSERFYNKARECFNDNPHIHCYYGDSKDVIKQILPKIAQDRAIFFWLDAHWCVHEDTAGETSQCPLLGELQAIEALNDNSFIVIDDARLFLSPPLAPHEISNWPSFNEVIDELRRISTAHKVFVLNDCIIYYPNQLHAAMTTFAYENGTDWLTVADKSRDYDKLLQQLQEKDKLILEQNEVIQNHIQKQSNVEQHNEMKSQKQDLSDSITTTSKTKRSFLKRILR